MARAKLVSRRQEKRSRVLKKQKRAPPRLINCRCYLRRYTDFIKEIKEQLIDAHKALIQRTPFYYMLDIPVITQERAVVDQLLHCWDESRRGFRLGGQMLMFRAEDVALILGLPLNGVAIDMKNHSENMFRTIHFAQSMVKRKALEDKIKILLSDSSSNAIRSTVQLLIIYLAGTILFPLSNLSIAKWIFSCVDPIEEIGRYAWARAIHEHLIQFIPRAAEKVKRKERGAKESSGYINGCVIILMVWLFERTGIVKPSTYGRLPRILNWEKPQFRKRVHYGEILKRLKEGHIRDPLQPTEDEVLLIKVRPSSYQTQKDEGGTSMIARKRSISDSVRSTATVQLMHKYQRIYMEAKRKRAGEDAEKTELRRIIAEQQKLINKLQEALDSKEGRKDAEGSTYKDIQFLSPGSPTVSREHADPQPTLRRVTQRVSRGSHLLRSPFIPLPSSTPAPRKKAKIKSVHKRDDIGGFFETNRDFPGLQLLDDEERRHVLDFLGQKIDRSLIWSDGISIINRLQVHDILSGNLIDDDVIDIFWSLLMQRTLTDPSMHLESCFMLRPFFTSMLQGTWKISDKAVEDFMPHSLAGVKRMFVPICSSVHWHLLVVDVEGTCFKHYTSLNGPQYRAVARRFVNWLTEMARDAYSIDMDSWSVHYVECPQQGIRPDCAIYVMHFIESLVTGVQITVTESRVPELRAKYAAQIIMKGHEAAPSS